MSLAALQRLPCPACGCGHDLFAWLDRALGAAGGARRVAVTCPRCAAAADLELGPGTAAIGAVVAGRPPLFRPERRVAQPGLRVQAGPEGLVVELLHRRFFVAPRRGGS